MLWDKASDISEKYIHQDYISEEIVQGEYPTPYQYTEYVEFQKNIGGMKNRLSQIGIFEWEEYDMTLKVIGYRE